VISARNSSSPRFLVSWVRWEPVQARDDRLQVSVGQGNSEDLIAPLLLHVCHSICQSVIQALKLKRNKSFRRKKNQAFVKNEMCHAGAVPSGTEPFFPYEYLASFHGRRLIFKLLNIFIAEDHTCPDVGETYALAEGIPR